MDKYRDIINKSVSALRQSIEALAYDSSRYVIVVFPKVNKSGIIRADNFTKNPNVAKDTIMINRINSYSIGKEIPIIIFDDTGTFHATVVLNTS